ncbi:MAG: molybdate ABC transporter substrate-binding protein [Peptostreptococcus sp.]|jgi:molybdate transport system substrate-binding protein|uniref:Molybdate-binding periplasmic protein n=2 Tax=Peptostreptococcus anaerobius TaxID=1261 RepID=A0A379CG24_9FIRM|nr:MULTISPECIES: molybdate ABC transporter substrate-binding protein [Peptostreptococcus]EKX91047.1 molybdate ABC transporter, periplasmic molybdate-binding protein [Peptostreptococcus anaerobius VPI 4330 = DSM 2949]MBS5595553.1 molybdate ABC transporter substrate-binding protein [Peptostreptococcus sp.]MCB6982204.1 molybdate ABC transporter substrate-binding protein [Peptostreptococcus anaerobius]MCQ5150305.1 molybdate ABC transporter substrate-binding protein [Peptostreptococcus anaerobius]M
MKKLFKGKLTTICFLLSMVLILTTTMTACSKTETKKEEPKNVNLFIAASLTDAVGEIVKDFEAENEGVKVVVNADSSGKLKSQILEGFDCDIFLSASTKEVEELKEKGLIVENSTKDLLENQLAIIASKDYDGQVKGLENIKDAKSIALPYGSVPAGYYARKALISEGIIKSVAKDADKATIKAIEGNVVSQALGGLTISEKDNVSSALSAVAEKATEVGFTYVSDAKRNENVKVISRIDLEKTGKIKYPIAKIKSKKDNKDREEIIEKLYQALASDKAKKVYVKYGFKVD